MSILPHENFERNLTTNFDINIEQLNQFKNLLRSTGAIIAGGSVLSSFHHGSNLKSFKQYKCNNMYGDTDYDTYVHFNKAKNLVEGIFELFPEAGFVNQCSYTLPPYDDSFFRKNDIIGRFMIHIEPTLYIDILVVKNEKSLVDVVKSFDLSFCKTWYDGINIFAINPNDVLNKEGTLSPDYVKPYLEGNVFTLGRIDKYRDKGYKILINLDSPSVLLQNRKTYERKNAYSAEDWVLCKVFKHIVFGSGTRSGLLPYDDFFDLDPFYRFVQLNPNSIIDLIESLVYNDFSEEEVKKIFVGTFYADYDFYHEPYSEYINLVLNKYFDISDIQLEFEKIRTDEARRTAEARRADEARRAEEARRTDDARQREEEIRKSLCREYITFLNLKGIKDGPTMARWQRGKDRDSEDFKKVIKAYKYVHQNNRCSDFKRDGSDESKRNDSGSKIKKSLRKKSIKKSKKSKRRKSKSRKKSGGRRKSKSRKKSGGRRKKSKK